MSGVESRDAGAVTNVAHQIGGALGLAIPVCVFAATSAAGLTPADALAHRLSAALSAGTLVLVLAAGVALAVRQRQSRSAPALQVEQ